MRKTLSHAVAAAVATLAAAGTVWGQDFADVIRARQGQFYIIQYNLKILEDMAANRMPYERQTAEYRANNIYIATRLHQDVNWLPGSDRADTPRTEAIDVRKNPKLFKQSFLAMMKSAEELKNVASNGPPMGLGQATSDLRGTCNACHVFYRRTR